MSFTPLFEGMLLDAAARFAQDHAAHTGFCPTQVIQEMGWAWTLVPEEAGGVGGVGGTLADLASVVEGLAGHGLQLPVVEACAVAPLLLLAAPPETAGRWLEAMVEGSAQLAPLTPLSATPGDLQLQARQLDIGWELSGEVRGVDAELQATQWIVPAALADGEPALFVVDADRLGAPAARYTTMEGRRSADFALRQLTLPAGACIARGGAAGEALARAEAAALLLTGVDTVAAIAALLQLTVIHLKERRQFGVALASFQALRHRTADMYVRYLASRGLLMHAFEAHAAGAPDLQRTLRLMKLALAESARACAEAAIQMHGGMGVSEEVLASRLAQRLLASEFRYGDRLTLAARLGAVEPATSENLAPTASRSSP